MSNDRLMTELSNAIETLRDRRSVLRGAAAAGVAGVGLPLLAACGGSDDASEVTPGGSTGSTSAPASSGATSAPATSGAPTSSGDQSSGAGNSVLGTTAEVPVGGGMIYKDAKVVVTQPTKDDFKGFTAVCTHAGCIVATVADGTINCACHGSKYSVTDGSVVNGPAQEPLAPVAVKVQSGEVLGPAS